MQPHVPIAPCACTHTGDLCMRVRRAGYPRVPAVGGLVRLLSQSCSSAFNLRKNNTQVLQVSSGCGDSQE